MQPSPSASTGPWTLTAPQTASPAELDVSWAGVIRLVFAPSPSPAPHAGGSPGSSALTSHRWRRSRSRWEVCGTSPQTHPWKYPHRNTHAASSSSSPWNVCQGARSFCLLWEQHSLSLQHKMLMSDKRGHQGTHPQGTWPTGPWDPAVYTGC